MDTTRNPSGAFSVTRLFWNERGAVCCERHIPYPGSDTWNWERWKPMEVHDAESWKLELGKLPRCECCGLEAALPPF